MRKIKLVIPLVPVSLNVIKGWLYHRNTKRIYPRLVKKWEDAIQDALIDIINPPRVKPLIKYANITVKYYFGVIRARDLDNYAGFKPLLDSLKGQVIEDDRDDWVKVEWELRVDKERPRTEIMVEERG